MELKRRNIYNFFKLCGLCMVTSIIVQYKLSFNFYKVFKENTEILSYYLFFGYLSRKFDITFHFEETFHNVVSIKSKVEI